MLQEAYGYQEFQYKEIARRFCIANSTDTDVTAFRAACYRQGVPTEALSVERWEIKAERIIGGGNKQMELGQINMLMAQYPKFSPEAQRKILRDFTFAATSDPARTNDLVPFDENQFNDSRYQAQLAGGTLMQGLPVEIPPFINHIDYCESLLSQMAIVIQQIEQTSPGMATKEQVIGLNNMANHVNQVIAIIADDDAEKQRVRQYSDVLGQMQNLLKGYAQRLQEQMQSQQGDPETAAKAQATLLLAQTKAQISEQTAAQKLEHKERAFEQKERQNQVKLQLDVQKQIQQTQLDTATRDVETAAEIQRQKVKTDSEVAIQEKKSESTEASGESSGDSKPAKKKKSKKIVRFKRGKGGTIESAEVEESD
jgi:hypothetical protein